MCQEVFEIVQKMDQSHIETRLALQCAPLITGVKIANLLIVSSCDEPEVRRILKKSSITYYRLLRKEGKTTFLLFHRLQLAAYLQDPDVQRILRAEGYRDLSLGGILRTFQLRFQMHMQKQVGFPHEMGLLLGYPVEDVEGFILDRGQNALYSGYWKVYANVSAKKRIFEEYEMAKEALIQLLEKGYDMQTIISFYQRTDRCEGGNYNDYKNTKIAG